MNIKKLRAFVPCKDYELSKQYYQELGFKILWQDNDLCQMGSKEYDFFLQNYFNKELAENFMLQMYVEDLESLFEKAKSLVKKYPNTKVRDIFDAPYGKTFHLLGPSGELWHMCK